MGGNQWTFLSHIDVSLSPVHPSSLSKINTHPLGRITKIKMGGVVSVLAGCLRVSRVSPTCPEVWPVPPCSEALLADVGGEGHSRISLPVTVQVHSNRLESGLGEPKFVFIGQNPKSALESAQWAASSIRGSSTPGTSGHLHSIPAVRPHPSAEC